MSHTMLPSPTCTGCPDFPIEMCDACYMHNYSAVEVKTTIPMQYVTHSGVMHKTCKVIDQTEEYYIYEDSETGKKEVVEKDAVNVHSIIVVSPIR